MSNDIECSFGILKGRWRILKYGLRFRKITYCDKMFITICALHNRLIKFDGLDKNWIGIRQIQGAYGLGVVRYQNPLKAWIYFPVKKTGISVDDESTCDHYNV